MAEIYTATLNIVECAHCHMDFGLTPGYEKDRRRDHGSFCCPLGHSQSYKIESDIERARRQRNEAQAQRDQARYSNQYNKRRAAAMKGHVTRLRRKIERGECPECGQVFKRLATHMKAKHPEFDTDVAE